MMSEHQIVTQSIETMIRRLLAIVLNRDLVLVKFAGEHSLRLVRYSADREPYVMMYGRVIRLDVDIYREVLWIRRKHFAPLKRNGNVIEFRRPVA